MSNDTQQTEFARTQPSEAPSENTFTEIVRFALIALLIVIPIRWFVAQPFIVSGVSMETTFANSDYLIVDQLSYRFKDPVRGDVIILQYPKDPSTYFIKRIIGLPGDTLAIHGHAITITNEENPEGFVLDEYYIPTNINNGQHDITLGEDEYFVMGDNRDHSSDSRIWGVLERDEIVGRAFLRLFPLKQISVWPGDNILYN